MWRLYDRISAVLQQFFLVFYGIAKTIKRLDISAFLPVGGVESGDISPSHSGVPSGHICRASISPFRSIRQAITSANACQQ